MFFGIIIYMYNERGGRHNTPHIHAIYQDHEAAIALDGTVIEGSLPSKKMKLVVAWIEIHAEELFANWKLLSDGQPSKFHHFVKRRRSMMLQPQITAVKPLSDYRLLLDFATGEQKIFNVSPYLHGDWYGKLRDANFFQTVHIEGNTVVWAGGQDIAPHELYNDSINRK